MLVPVGHLTEANHFRHLNDTINLVQPSSSNFSLLPRHSFLLTSEEVLPFQRSSSNTKKLVPASGLNQHQQEEQQKHLPSPPTILTRRNISYALCKGTNTSTPSVTAVNITAASQRRGTNPQHVVKTTCLPLAAARRLAKLCLEDRRSAPSRHKALLFTGNKSTPSIRLGSPAPLLSKHLKKRRARADSYSSSSSDSTSEGPVAHLTPTMARDLRSMYEAVQGGVSRLTEDLANSLYIEKSAANTKTTEYLTSPSCESTYSDHSLFSQSSHLSNFTSISSRPTSDTGHCMLRTSYAHPSAQKILSLHQHSPEGAATPRKAHLQTASADQVRLRPMPYVLTSRDASPPLEDARSRYFARRNAIAPVAERDGIRRNTSSFGPVRTSKAIKTARIPLATSHVSTYLSF